MNPVSDRLRELTRPTGEEELLTVDFPRPRLKVPVPLALGLVAVAVVGLVVWLGLSSRPAPNPYLEAAVSSEPAEPSELIVSVVGEVDNPGLVTLPPGARVADALSAARPRPEADLLALNQAQRLKDGEQVVVAKPGEQPAEPAEEGALSLNTASAEQLTQLKGIGEVTAEAIVAHREEIGGFSSIEQLLDVSGIGPAKMETIKDQVRL
ncbi:ComEA family DNA-binding protein [Corynebacterium sp.]|uniref:ComEA family DNA-binding protein n=1 Tax=Corynebacterium sp. TaxID=1720 RepID=UPI0026DD2519|nr:ComEA family DNA-binding protein [Corynebacterium sp.]MDO5031076.1 ComEA family DNA-binding protein [Corynebacterium sp.]